MTNAQRINRLFGTIDRLDVEGFLTFLAPTCRFQFGNMLPVVGTAGIKEAVQSFFESIDGLSHEIIGLWEIGNTTICHGNVTYTRKDKSDLSVPFANIMHGKSGGITEYLIFADVSKLHS
jgi:ketosteroid isomerase-like protein